MSASASFVHRKTCSSPTTCVCEAEARAAYRLPIAGELAPDKRELIADYWMVHRADQPSNLPRKDAQSLSPAPPAVVITPTAQTPASPRTSAASPAAVSQPKPHPVADDGGESAKDREISLEFARQRIERGTASDADHALVTGKRVPHPVADDVEESAKEREISLEFARQRIERGTASDADRDLVAGKRTRSPQSIEETDEEINKRLDEQVKAAREEVDRVWNANRPKKG